jgi:hypothetical protein
MTIQEIFDLAVSLGRRYDFREKSVIDERLARIKKQYDAMAKKEKAFFDVEKLTNPYSDSAIHYTPKKTIAIRRVLAGIDIDGEELLLADKWRNDAGKCVDLVIAHHPVGKALAGLDSVMDLQADIFESYGIPINIAEKLIHKRISEVSRGINAINHYQVVDIARLLDVPFLNVHTPADNMVASFLAKQCKSKNPKYVGDILDMLLDIPEYQEAARQGVPPCLFAGSKDNRAGRIAVSEITGGTEGNPEMYEKLAQAGIGTVLSMHQSEKHREAAEKAHINVVIAGHISSDSIGMNLFLDELEKRGIEIVPCSGLIRHSRVSGKKV